MNLYSDCDILLKAVKGVTRRDSRKKSLKLLHSHAEIALRELSLDSFAKFENDLYEVLLLLLEMLLFLFLLLLFLFFFSL